MLLTFLYISKSHTLTRSSPLVLLLSGIYEKTSLVLLKPQHNRLLHEGSYTMCEDLTCI